MDDNYSDEPGYEEDVEEPSKKDQADMIFRSLHGRQTRKQIIDAFQRQLGLSPSSSTAYYERIARKYGQTGQGDDNEMMMPTVRGDGQDQFMMGQQQGEEDMVAPEDQYGEVQDWEDPNRAGDIRTVNGAHLVYKRQIDDGSFEELWIFKNQEDFKKELEIRRDILAGTDIPVSKTQSENGSQNADQWSSGDINMLKINGLVN